jgi:hypothetical protein
VAPSCNSSGTRRGGSVTRRADSTHLNISPDHDTEGRTGEDLDTTKARLEKNIS